MVCHFCKCWVCGVWYVTSVGGGGGVWYVTSVGVQGVVGVVCGMSLL